MQTQYQDIKFPRETHKALTARLHYLENPRIKKRANGIEDLKLTYEQALEFQKQCVQQMTLQPLYNQLLVDILEGQTTASETLDELSKIDNFPVRYLPRKKDPVWNQRVQDLQALVGVNYTETPKRKLTTLAEDFFQPNSSILINLSKKGLSNPANPVACAEYIAAWNGLIGLGVDALSQRFPDFTLLGLGVGALFGAGLGAMANEIVRRPLPFEEADYLDFKLKELKLIKESTPNILKFTA